MIWIKVAILFVAAVFGQWPFSLHAQTRERQIGLIQLGGAKLNVSVSKTPDAAPRVMIWMRDDGVMSISCGTDIDRVRGFIAQLDSMLANTTKPAPGETISLGPIGLACSPSSAIGVARRIGSELEWVVMGMPIPSTYRIIAGNSPKYMPKFIQVFRDAVVAAEQMQAP